MSDVKLFREQDQDFSFKEDSNASVFAFVNSGISDGMGGGYGVFGAGTNMEWTVTYDEFLFIHKGNFQLKVGDEVYHAGPGDTLWIPKDTPLSYICDEDVWFFFAVNPAAKSPSASQAIDYPTKEPAKA